MIDYDIDELFCANLLTMNDINFKKLQLDRIDLAITALSGYVNIPPELANKKIELEQDLYTDYRHIIFDSPIPVE